MSGMAEHVTGDHAVEYGDVTLNFAAARSRWRMPSRSTPGCPPMTRAMSTRSASAG